MVSEVVISSRTVALDHTVGFLRWWYQERTLLDREVSGFCGAGINEVLISTVKDVVSAVVVQGYLAHKKQRHPRTLQ